MFDTTFSEIVDFGQGLDSSLVGEAYLKSPKKQLLDRYGARVLSPFFAPFATVAKLAVWAEDGSPTTIGLDRIGKDGQVFKQLKIRSMTKGSELAVEPALKKERDDLRIIKVGKFIRQRSIDELLQLKNVRNGEMSLVGPRPKTPQEITALHQLDSDFSNAYTVHHPGMTGLEQINGRAELSPREIIEFTKEYATEACLALDLDILRKTPRAVFSKDGAY